MNWLSEIDDSEQQSINEMNAGGLGKAPKQPKKEVGLFDGAVTAIPRGVAAGAVKVYDTAKKPFERVADHLQYSIDDVRNGGLDGALDVREKSFSDVHEEKNKDRRDTLVMQVEELQDAPNSGFVGNMLFGISDMGTRVLAGAPLGPVGAALTTGVTEVNYSREDLIHKGVDEDTATTAALIDGGVAAASTVLPLSYGFKGTGGLVKDAALSIGGATALSTAGQYASGQVLESDGYDKQAKKYEITGESVATDVVLNTLMFGGARGVSHYLNRTPEQVEADTTQVQSTLVANELEFDNAASPVKPSNPVQANNHFKNMDEAQTNLRSGRPVNVQHTINGTPKDDKKVTAAKAASYTNKPWAKTIAHEAEKRGIDPVNALVISHIETGGTFSSSIQPRNKKGELLSSATGLFQTLDSTFKAMGGKNKFDGNDQINAGLNYYKHNADIFRNEFGRDPSGLEVYFMHFFGEGGGPVFLKAKDNELFVDVATRWSKGTKKKTAREVASGITNSHGFQNMTVGQVKAKYQKRWNEVAKQYGGDGTNIQTAHALDGSSYDMAYEVKSLGELIASNDLAYGVNPLYPTDLQPRDRTREASRQQIENMADDLKPEWLGESAKLSDGAPIIGVDNVVESGNGRTLAINRAYETGKADNYRAYIEKYAAEKGWDISGIDRPVLVRTRLTDTDRVQFTKLANEADVAQYSASERATTDVDRLPDASLLKINNDGSINLDGSMDFIRGFVNSLPESEKPNILTDDGRLSQGGKQRIESAIMQSAYDNSSLVTRLYENIDDDSKTVLNALLRAAPQLAQLGSLVKQGGRHTNTLAKDLSQAAQKLSDLKASGQTVDDYLNQIQLIDDGLSNGAKQFLNVFDTNKRSAKAISDNIQSEIDRIEGMGDPRQGSLFGDGPEESAALDIIMQNPDQQISVSRMRPDVEMEEITMTLRERLDELEAEAKQAEQDTLAAQTAISCALQFGE
jgi:hypothetical protein